MPPSRRGNANTYCKSMVGLRPRGTNVREMVASISDRYRKVNLQAYVKHGTVEFRHHSGSCNPTKVMNWVRFVTQFVEASRTTEQASSVVEAMLGGSERSIVTALQRSPQTIEALAQCAEVGIESAKCVISRIRAKGYRITLDRRRSCYVLEGREATATGVNNRTSLWDGIEPSLRSYYAARTSALSGNSEAA